MIEVLRTNDPVRLSYAVALLKEAGCHPQLADRFMSAMEGSISAIQRRLLVPNDEEKLARAALAVLDSAPVLLEEGGQEDGPAEAQLGKSGADRPDSETSGSDEPEPGART